jgi:hypothetical protein
MGAYKEEEVMALSEFPRLGFDPFRQVELERLEADRPKKIEIRAA